MAASFFYSFSTKSCLFFLRDSDSENLRTNIGGFLNSSEFGLGPENSTCVSVEKPRFSKGKIRGTVFE